MIGATYLASRLARSLPAAPKVIRGKRECVEPVKIYDQRVDRSRLRDAGLGVHPAEIQEELLFVENRNRSYCNRGSTATQARRSRPGLPVYLIPEIRV